MAYMELSAAVEVVLELARGNLCDEEELPEEHERQVVACNVVEDFAVNHLGEE